MVRTLVWCWCGAGVVFYITVYEDYIMPPKKTTAKKVTKKPTAGEAGKNGPGARTSHIGEDTVCATCGICEQPIVDGKDQAVYCEGACKQWLHRYCVGIPLSCFQALSSSLAPFQCYSCYQAKHEAAIESLNSEVRALKSEVSEIKAVINGLMSQPNVLQDSVASSRQVSNVDELLSRPVLEATAARSYASAANAPQDPATTSATLAHPPSTSTVANPRISQERKFNVIIYGIDECPRGTSRPSRLQGDLDKAVLLLSGLDNSINSQCVKDVFRLGKFSVENQKPRPVLVKFIRAADAISVLSKRGSLRSSPIFIKPDMSPTEKKSESMLLKERWSLIQSGVRRDVIKIRGSRLFVSNKLHGQVRVSGTSLSLCLHNSTVDVHNDAVLTSPPIVQTREHTTPLSQSQLDTSTVALDVLSCSEAATEQPPSPQPQSIPSHPSQLTAGFDPGSDPKQ